MKATGLKALALAMVGIAGFAVAGSAFAQCPTADQTKNTIHSPGGGGAWTSQFIANDASLNISTPGLAGTNCALSVAIGALSNSRVYVQDSSPNNEARYRARFYVSLANLTTFGGVTNKTAQIFRVNDTTAPATASSDQLVVRLVGSPTGAQVRFYVGDANSGSGQQQIIVPLPTSASNVYRIETDLQIGSAATSAAGACNTMPASGGCFRYWVNADTDPSGSDTAPTGSYTVNNSGWSGAKTAFLGLTNGTLAYRNAHAGVVIIEDEFDSRRQTFIGQ
jgi:hypothetical protein